MLQFYNSLTRKKEKFVPLNPGKIGFYVCGITVYDRCHLGHARSMVCFDVMVRFLRTQGYDVTYVRNITDIDDKIIKRANERNVTIDELTTTYIDAMHADAKALNILPPTLEPRATENVSAIIRLIQKLMDTGHAYQADNGDVCFDVRSHETYGKLSRKDLDALISGARIDVVDAKRSPMDFVLWKQSKEGEPSWPSPWGSGRPGWHIECSAMSMETLGEQFDIHGGGLDLQFPHHENEIAQSEAATNKKFANYWLHVGMLQVNQEKMAKSVGNFFTIEEVLKQYPAEVIRYFLLSCHYRSPLNYSEENLENAMKSLQRLYQTLKIANADKNTALESVWTERFDEAMCDDFNTPEALSVLFQLSHEANRTGESSKVATLKYLAARLGLLEMAPEQFLQGEHSEAEIQRIQALIDERAAARKDRDFQRSDEIRDQLLAEGIELEDGPGGTSWRTVK